MNGRALLFSFLLVCGGCGGAEGEARAPAGGGSMSAAGAASSSTPLEKKATAFVAELARHDYAHPATRFDAKMASALPPEKLGEVWSSVEKNAGAFVAVEATRTESKDGFEAVLVTSKLAKLRRVVRVVFESGGDVAGLFFLPVADDLEAKVRNVFENAERGDWGLATQDFDTGMRRAVPPAKLETVWKSAEAQLGRYRSVDGFAMTLDRGSGLWKIDGTVHFERGDLAVDAAFDPEDRIAGLLLSPPSQGKGAEWSAPPYATPSSFEEREVKVGTSPALPGTPTVPRAGGSGAGAPAVVLVHGSGPSERDEVVGGTRVFKDLAWGLATKGIAVLRYEKRTRVAPAGVRTEKEEVRDGAHDAIELLRGTPGVDAKRIYVVGHSQGASQAPLIAKENPGVAGIVSMAGPTRPFADVLLDQLAYFASLDPKNEALAKKVDEAKAFKKTLEDPALAGDTDVPTPLGISIKAEYFLAMRGYDPVATAAALPAPVRVMVLQGERDYQVSMKDFAGWKKGLASRRDAALYTYPELNHLFVAGTGPSTPAEYMKPGHVDVHVIDTIAGWILR